MADVLTPEQVAEQIRTAERAFDHTNDEYPWWLASLRALLDEINRGDTVDALREKVTLLEGEVEAVATKEGIENVIDQAVEVATVDLREQLRKRTEAWDNARAEIDRLDPQIRHLTFALRNVRHRAAPYPDGAGRELSEGALVEIQQIVDRALAERESDGV